MAVFCLRPSHLNIACTMKDVGGRIMSFSGKASSHVNGSHVGSFAELSSTEFGLCFSMFTPDLEYENVNEMHLGS